MHLLLRDEIKGGKNLLSIYVFSASCLNAMESTKTNYTASFRELTIN